MPRVDGERVERGGELTTKHPARIGGNILYRTAYNDPFYITDLKVVKGILSRLTNLICPHKSGMSRTNACCDINDSSSTFFHRHPMPRSAR